MPAADATKAKRSTGVCVRLCVCVCEASLKDGRMSERGGVVALQGVRCGVTGGPTATRFEVDMRLRRSACDVHIRSHSRRWGASSQYAIMTQTSARVCVQWSCRQTVCVCVCVCDQTSASCRWRASITGRIMRRTLRARAKLNNSVPHPYIFSLSRQHALKVLESLPTARDVCASAIFPPSAE